MRKVKFTIAIELIGNIIEHEFEFSDDTTDDEIQDAYNQWKLKQLAGGWEEIK